MEVKSNILDPIHDSLPESVWENPADPRPRLKPQHRKWITATVTRVLKDAGYTHVEGWLDLVLTGSLTTYQYSAESDCDVSLFVNAEVFPEWSRAELIGLMVSHVDGTKLPGTGYLMQCFVVPSDIKQEDLYKPGLRSGYDLEKDEWIEPPDRYRAHDVQREQNNFYVYALEQADKMERLLRYEPDKAILLWHQIHKRRQRDQRAGKGDYSESNIIYKFLANRGLFPAISEASGEYIAKEAQSLWAYHATPVANRQSILTNGLQMTHARNLSRDPGIYFYTDEAKAHAHAAESAQSRGEPWEVWRFPVPADAQQNALGFHYTPSDIPGHQISLAALAKHSKKEFTKFIYDPATNHLVLGNPGAEEGENESHNQLLHKSGIDPENAVFGQFDSSGHVETFGRPLIRGFSQPSMNQYEADYKLKQALDQAVPGLSYSVFEPPHDAWDTAGPPQISYIGQKPTVNPDEQIESPTEESQWKF